MHPGDDTASVLGQWGFEPAEVEKLRATGAVL
jgi:hypothetical protein